MPKKSPKRSLLCAFLSLALAACDEVNVEDPDRFVLENLDELEQIVTSLRGTGLIQISDSPYEGTMKTRLSDEDAVIYARISDFVKRTNIRFIETVDYSSARHDLPRVTFFRANLKYHWPGVESESIIYIDADESPSKLLYNNGESILKHYECSLLEVNRWHFCKRMLD